MGRLLVVVVGLSIVAFVLGDVLSGNSALLGGNSRDLGEISGETITQAEFVNMVEGMKQNFQATYGQPANEFITQTFRNQAWEQLINEIAYGERLEQLDIVVGDAEKVDMVQGNNIAPAVRQNFADPQTGQFSVELVRQRLAEIAGSEVGRFQWAQFQQQISAQRQLQKFENFFAKSNYVTLAEAKRQYNNDVATIDIDYLYVPFGIVNDSIAPVSDNELRAYLNEHKDEYQVEESRSIDYVSFPVVPSAEDSAAYKADIDAIRDNLANSQTVEEDSLIAIRATEQGQGFGTFDPTALPVDIENNLATLKPGDIVGPKLSGGIYSMSKLSDVIEGENEYVRISQIMIGTEGSTAAEKRAARSKALGILREVRNGADFAETARTKSEDGSGLSSGDMGWYRKGSGPVTGSQDWPQALQDAAFAARSTGVINRLVESDKGYHIINVVNAPNKKRYKVATIIVEMVPSTETQNTVYRQVQEFLASVDDYDSFNAYANEQGISVFSGNNIGPNATAIGRLTDARQIVTWLYGEAKSQDVRDFDLNDEYIVALYRYKVEAGTAKLGDVRNQIEPKVRNQKKLAYIQSKLDGLSGSLNEMATAYGRGAAVYSAPGLKLSSNSLPNVGTAPEAVGAAFGLQNIGERTKALGTDVGVVLIELKAQSPAPEIGDYTSQVTQIRQRKQGNDRLNISQSIREAANIVDERYKFY
jgi:peptidyl-prolyl cis-trans isomerase D